MVLLDYVHRVAEIMYSLSQPTKTLFPITILYVLFQTQHQNHNAATERERKAQSRISAPWMFVRRNSNKEKHGERPASIAFPMTNGNIKPVSNGNMKAIANGGDVEL